MKKILIAYSVSLKTICFANAIYVSSENCTVFIPCDDGLTKKKVIETGIGIHEANVFLLFAGIFASSNFINNWEVYCNLGFHESSV